MIQLIRNLKAEAYKMKRTGYGWIHIAIPIVIVSIFLGYYSFAAWDETTKIAGFYSVLGMGTPIIISLAATLVTDQELKAGGYQNILVMPDRTGMICSKLLLSMVMGTGSLMGTSILFGLGNLYLLHQDVVTMKFYIAAGLFLICETMVLYSAHFFLGLRFGKNISVLAGLAEGILSALLQTGLGDGIWPVIPSAWSTRFTYNYLHTKVSDFTVEPACKTATILCTVLSVFAIIGVTVWFCKWEGTHSEE